jgi:hypothetical protein
MPVMSTASLNDANMKGLKIFTVNSGYICAKVGIDDPNILISGSLNLNYTIHVIHWNSYRIAALIADIYMPKWVLMILIYSSVGH